MTNLTLTSFNNLPASFRAICADTEVGSSFVHGQCWTWDEGMGVGYSVADSIIWVLSINGARRLVEARSIKAALAN